MLVNAISLKPFPQSTSNLKFVFILIIGQMLLILGHLPYACERDIFKTVSPIDFKLEICFHINYRTDAIDFGPSAKTKMAAIIILKSDYSLWCEHDTSSTIYFINRLLF